MAFWQQICMRPCERAKLVPSLSLVLSTGAPRRMTLSSSSPSSAARPHHSPGAAWRCQRCDRYLGTVADGVLTEPNKDRSTLPVLRYCPRCGECNLLDDTKV